MQLRAWRRRRMERRGAPEPRGAVVVEATSSLRTRSDRAHARSKWRTVARQALAAALCRSNCARPAAMPTLDAAFDEASGSSSRTPSPVGLEAGAGRRSISLAVDEDEKVRRLSVWEDQLHAYQHELADEGWKSWKRGAVNSLMNELQRKVVPEVWREEVAQSRRKEAELNNALRRAGEKERALLARIDALENGPGCARELQAQLEAWSSSR